MNSTKMEITPAVFNAFYEDERAKQVKEFQETKTGVKGVVDSGVTKVPTMFIHPPENRPNPISEANNGSCFQVPLIDFAGLRNGKRKEIVNQIREAASTWGFFQIVNHEVPVATMDKLLDGIRGFNEQPAELKQKLWNLDDPTRKVIFYGSSFQLPVMKAGSWRDALTIREAETIEKEELPPICREGVMEYTKCLMSFKETMCELFSEALGLSSDLLTKNEVAESVILVCNYYPACPEPELTWGLSAHKDPNFITLILQDNVGGLQVLHQHTWVDVPAIHGSLLLNLGDLMQLLTNDKFKSVEHRARVVKDHSRISVAAFFYSPSAKATETFGPIKEFLSESNPPIYRETTVGEFLNHFKISYAKNEPCLPHFKLSS